MGLSGGGIGVSWERLGKAWDSGKARERWWAVAEGGREGSHSVWEAFLHSQLCTLLVGCDNYCPLRMSLS